MLNGIYKKFKKGKIPYSFLPSLFKMMFSNNVYLKSINSTLKARPDYITKHVI
jgi:hypothetical protein